MSLYRINKNMIDPQLVQDVEQVKTELAGIALFVDQFPKLDTDNDDTQRFQRMMDEIKINGGGSIYLKQNTTYTINQWVLESNIIINGNGATIKYNTTATDGTTDNNVVYALSKSNITILNLKVDGGKTVETVTSTGQHGGVWIENSENILIYNCKVSNTGCDGIAIRSCYNTIVENCFVSNTYEDGIVSNHDVGLYGSPTKEVNLKVINNTVTNSRGDAIIVKNPNAIVSGNKAMNAGEGNSVRCGGIIIGTDGDIRPHDVVCTGNSISNVTGSAIFSAGAIGVIIKENIIVNNTSHTNSDYRRGIEVVEGVYSGVAEGFTNGVVSDNYIDSYHYGIFVHGAKNITVKGNHIKTAAVGHSAILVDNSTNINTEYVNVESNTVDVENTGTVAIKVALSANIQSNNNIILKAFDGILFDGVLSSEINNNFISGGVARNGITSKDGTALISGNKIKGCGTTGIFVRGGTNAKDNFVTNNSTTNNDNGIFVDSTTGKNVIANNFATGNVTVNINANESTNLSVAQNNVTY